MIATDPLSLVFLACIVFSGVFLIISMVSGIGHGVHIGGHVAHVTHVAHAGHTAQIGHAGHLVHAGDTGQAQATHLTNGSGGTSSTIHTAATATPAQPSPLAAVENAFLASLNLYSILVFLLVFGLLGYLLNNATNLGAVLSIVLALLVGDGFAVAIGLLLTRLFVSSDAQELTSDSSRLEGRMGHVSMAIRENGVGEVIFTGAAGGRQSIGARSLDDSAIPVDAEVVIVSYENGIATVQQWDAFIVGLRAGTAPALAPIDLPK